MGSSRQLRLSGREDVGGVSLQVETITERVESELLTIDPGRNATVLAHNDFAVGGPRVQQASAGAGKFSDHPHV